jgi:molecular chaperone GrpE
MKNFFKMSKKNNDPVVDDELLKTVGAEPEEHVLVDEVEAGLEDYLEEGAVADLDNMVASLEAQVTEKDEMDTAGRRTMMALLPVVDDFDRAAKQAESDPDTKKVWDSGLGLIVKKMMKTLEGQGLKPMVSTGEVFNADFHEAITEIPAPEMAGKVVDTVENGYFLNEKIIRHAKVVVGK